MISRFIKLAWRHALRFKSYSVINVAGLTIGLASAIVILLFVSEEFSYDRFHEKSENIYRLVNISQRTNGTQAHAAATPLLAPTLMTDLAEVEAAVRLRHADNVLIKVGDNHFYEDRVFYADSNFFKVLSFPLAHGDARTALKELNSAVITSEFANKFFGGTDPMGKLLQVNDLVLKVTGITAPVSKSHFNFDILISFETFTVPIGYPVTLQSWSWLSFPTYVRLKDGVTASDVETKLPALLKKYLSEDAAKRTSYQLQPIQDIYLHSRNILERDGISTKGDYTYTMILAAIAALILGIACFNFTNLSAALSSYRIKETGVKRTLGSTKSEVFFQLIAESIAIVTLSLALALIIVAVGIPTFERLLDVDLRFSFTDQLTWIPSYSLMVILIGLIGGIYPAMLLSQLKPQIALKGKQFIGMGARGLSFGKVIVMIQFFITAALIAISLTIKSQMDFLSARDLGFEKEDVVVLRVPGNEMSHVYPSVKNKLLQNPYVASVSASGNLFDGQQGNMTIEEVGVSSEEPLRINLFGAFPGFIEVMGLQMLEGRTFSEARDEQNSVILNEAAVKMFGWRNGAVGRKVSIGGRTSEVVGVVRDFHFSSLHSPIGPLIIQVPEAHLDLLFVRVHAGQITEIMNSIEADWKSANAGLPFDYLFLDEHIGQMYKQDEKFSKLTFIFCALSVTLACIGLYGIISFIAEMRTKEIGIRKVLGASVFRITALLSGEFMIWVSIAAICALPVANYLIGQWLAEFAYKVEISVSVFIFSLVLCASLAAISISFKSIKAALANPVDSLRNE